MLPQKQMSKCYYMLVFCLLIIVIVSFSVGGMDEWQTHEVFWGQKKQPLPVQTLNPVPQSGRPGPGPQPQGGTLQPARPGVWLLQRIIYPAVWKCQTFHHPDLPHHTWDLGPLPHRQSWRKDVGSGGKPSSCKVALALTNSVCPTRSFIFWLSEHGNKFLTFSSHLCFFFCLLQVRKRVKLEGKELEDYLEKDKIKKEAAKKLVQEQQ